MNRKSISLNLVSKTIQWRLHVFVFCRFSVNTSKNWRRKVLETTLSSFMSYWTSWWTLGTHRPQTAKSYKSKSGVNTIVVRNLYQETWKHICIFFNFSTLMYSRYHQTSDISCTSVDNKIVDHSDVVGALPVSAAPTTPSFSTQHRASMDWAKTSARRDEKHLNHRMWYYLYWRFDIIYWLIM